MDAIFQRISDFELLDGSAPHALLERIEERIEENTEEMRANAKAREWQEQQRMDVNVSPLDKIFIMTICESSEEVRSEST